MSYTGSGLAMMGLSSTFRQSSPSICRAPQDPMFVTFQQISSSETCQWWVEAGRGRA